MNEKKNEYLTIGQAFRWMSESERNIVNFDYIENGIKTKKRGRTIKGEFYLQCCTEWYKFPILAEWEISNFRF